MTTATDTTKNGAAPQPAKPEPIVYEVDPDRLAYGRWCHRRDKQVGQGNIDASYSADRIGMGQPIRKPFEWRGELWVCVGKGPYNGTQSAKADRLIDPRIFDGTPTTYAEKVRRDHGDAARADPLGFYNGMSVKSAGAELVLCGPPATFVPGQKRQFDLFE